MIASWLLAFCHLLMWTTVPGLDTVSSPQPSCCSLLSVDQVIYHFLGWDTRALAAGCRDSCTYTSPEKAKGTSFCFKDGASESVCMATTSTTDTITLTTTSSTTTTTTTTTTNTTTTTTNTGVINSMETFVREKKTFLHMMQKIQ